MLKEQESEPDYKTYVSLAKFTQVVNEYESELSNAKDERDFFRSKWENAHQSNHDLAKRYNNLRDTVVKAAEQGKLK